MKKLILALGAAFTVASCAASCASEFIYDEETSGPSPIPAAERGLKTETAKRWLRVSDEQQELEGAAFGFDGRLYFCNENLCSVMKVTKDKKIEKVLTLDGYLPGGVAFGSDGRMYVAALNTQEGRGFVASVKPDGMDFRYEVPVEAGYVPNDLALDSRGGFYFSDFKGSDAEPTGGVYYAAPDRKVTPVIKNLAKANGVALSPDESVLWATEFERGRLHRAILEAPAKVWDLGRYVAYNFIGPAPDSMRADADGNVYVAMYWQGRVMIFNKNGIPIGQALLEDRGDAQIASTSLAINPDRKEMYIVGRVIKKGEGAWIYKSPSFAPGLSVSYSRDE